MFFLTARVSNDHVDCVYHKGKDERDAGEREGEGEQEEEVERERERVSPSENIHEHMRGELAKRSEVEKAAMSMGRQRVFL